MNGGTGGIRTPWTTFELSRPTPLSFVHDHNASRIGHQISSSIAVASFGE